jgi:four helix bundle protein
MGTIKRFEDILAWQRARVLALKIHELATSGTFERDFKLRDQINGSSGSIMDNISEGFERDGRKEFILFLSYSKGSCGEVKSQLYRALDRKHINHDQFEELYNETEAIGKMIGGLMRYLSESNIAGNKFKEPFVPYGNQKEEPEDDNTFMLHSSINDPEN